MLLNVALGCYLPFVNRKVVSVIFYMILTKPKK